MLKNIGLGYFFLSPSTCLLGVVERSDILARILRMDEQTDNIHDHTMKLSIISLIGASLMFVSNSSKAQDEVSATAKLPVFAFKTNLIYDALTTINLSGEVGLGKQTSIDVAASYNPWKYRDGGKMKHWLIQPQFRFWFKERFNGWFVGAEFHYGTYNVGGIGVFGLNKARYQGWLVGGGVTGGFAWKLGGRWNMEAELGFGYARIGYDKYDLGCKCDKHISTGAINYMGPTKIALSVILTL